jgi:hypothetical protein
LRVFAATLLLVLSTARAARAESPAAVLPPGPTAALRGLETEYEERFPMAVVYWGGSAALVGTGIALLAMARSPETHPSDRLSLFSGTATLISGLSCGFSALPLTLSRVTFRRRLALAEGRPMDDALARSILTEHAAWARGFRIATQIVTPALLAVDGTLYGSYALHNSYDRVAAGVIAGLYGVGVPVVLWFDSLPSPEERALQKALRASPLSRVSVGPTLVPSRAVALGVGLSGTFE